MPTCADALHAWKHHVVIDRQGLSTRLADAQMASGLTAHWICLRCRAQRFDAAWPGAERRRAPRGGRLDTHA